MGRQHFDFYERAGEIINAIPKCVFITTADGGRVNTMAIEWGTVGNLWAKPVFVCYVRNSRFTREMLDRNPEFTINIPTGPYDKKIFRVCGGKSGRDIDKVEAAGLTLEEGEKVSVPGIRELPMTLECKVIYRQDQDVSLIPDGILSRFYPRKSAPGMHDSYDDDHVTYIGEIVDCYILD